MSIVRSMIELRRTLDEICFARGDEPEIVLLFKREAHKDYFMAHAMRDDALRGMGNEPPQANRLRIAGLNINLGTVR